ncbi:MAG: RNA methyltransferase [Clostridiales bacterium]|nr:RNA methyltransferase [Clostridiales bacterium]
MEIIKSKVNENIKIITKLNTSTSFRKKQGLFVVEGARLCSDALQTGAKIKKFFYTEKAMENYSEKISPLIEKAEKSFIISEEISTHLSQTQSPQGVFCVVEMLDKNESNYKINKDGVYIILENVQDPANLGAVCRTAEALGVDGVFVSGGCDIYNPKAQRAAMGSLFRINVFETDDIIETIRMLKSYGITVSASTPREDALDIAEFSEKYKGVACVIGNEGNGVTEKTFSVCDCLVTIPMRGRAESLNASVAASIIMYQLMK